MTNAKEIGEIRADCERLSVNVTEEDYKRVDNLITDMKERGIWDSIDVIHAIPFHTKSTATTPAVLINLKR